MLVKSCEMAAHVLVSLAQVVVILPQVSPMLTFDEFASVVVGFDVFIIASKSDSYESLSSRRSCGLQSNPPSSSLHTLVQRPMPAGF